MVAKVVHCKKEPFDVYIGRGSVWGNPFSHKKGTAAKFIVDSREEAIQKFEEYLVISPDLLEKVKELGNYRITWKQNLPTDIEMYLSSHKVIVESGKYHIFSENGTFKHQLFSSEFIEFTLKEMREYKLNKILKEI